jgi:hypothetical protein
MQQQRPPIFLHLCGSYPSCNTHQPSPVFDLFGLLYQCFPARTRQILLNRAGFDILWLMQLQRCLRQQNLLYFYKDPLEVNAMWYTLVPYNR